MKKRGFTLIELLVVIAIIALLMAVILPSLGVAKQAAFAAMCLANQRGLSLAWHSYQEDNSGFIVGGSTYHIGNNATPYRWVERPLFNETDNPEVNLYPPDNAIIHKFRINGIRAGKLFPYVNNEKAYNCPGHPLWKRETNPARAVYRSYSIAGLMNSEHFISRVGNLYTPIDRLISVNFPNGPRELKVATRFGEIRSPGTKYVFVEEDVSQHGQAYPLGGFVLMREGYASWQDHPAWYHNGQSTLGFADGHAERKRWEDKRTLDLMNPDATAPLVQPNNPDLEWLIRGYLPRM